MSNNDNHNKKHSSNPNDNQENQYQASPMDQGDKIVDMKKFDQSEIMKLIQHATEIGKPSNEKLSKPFLDSILSMKLSGSDMHKDIGNHINNEHKSVLKSFNNVFKSVSDYVNDTQNMQSTERSSDFKKAPVIEESLSDEDKKELQRKLNDVKTYLEIIGKSGVVTIKGTDIFVGDKLFDYEEVKTILEIVKEIKNV